MKATITFLILVFVGTLPLHAETAMQVVILTNGNLIEGKVTFVDSHYVIRSSTGEFTLDRNRVAAVVASKQEAFKFVAERSNRRDADERLRLAQWCYTHDLLDQAISEAEAASQMRPSFSAAEQLLRALRISKESLAKVDPKVVPAKAGEPAKVEKTVDVPDVEYNSESFPMFASKVNAILMNMCASCHAREETSKFRILRLSGRAGMGKNLMSALAQINPKDPLTSPLLTKAIAPHGTATEPPMKSRSHPAYQTLETWVRFARATEGTTEPEPLPAPMTTSTASTTTAPPTEPQKLPMLDDPKTEPTKADLTKSEPKNKPVETPFGADSKTVPMSVDKPAGNDPFDPAKFNNAGKPKPQ